MPAAVEKRPAKRGVLHHNGKSKSVPSPSGIRDIQLMGRLLYEHWMKNGIGREARDQYAKLTPKRRPAVEVAKEIIESNRASEEELRRERSDLVAAVKNAMGNLREDDITEEYLRGLISGLDAVRVKAGSTLSKRRVFRKLDAKELLAESKRHGQVFNAEYCARQIYLLYKHFGPDRVRFEPRKAAPYFVIYVKTPDIVLEHVEGGLYHIGVLEVFIDLPLLKKTDIYTLMESVRAKPTDQKYQINPPNSLSPFVSSVGRFCLRDAEPELCTAFAWCDLLSAHDVMDRMLQRPGAQHWGRGDWESYMRICVECRGKFEDKDMIGHHSRCCNGCGVKVKGRSKPVDPDQVVEHNGEKYHRDDIVHCSATKRPMLRSEAVRLAGRLYHPDALATCELTGRRAITVGADLAVSPEQIVKVEDRAFRADLVAVMRKTYDLNSPAWREAERVITDRLNNFGWSIVPAHYGVPKKKESE